MNHDRWGCKRISGQGEVGKDGYTKRVNFKGKLGMVNSEGRVTDKEIPNMRNQCLVGQKIINYTNLTIVGEASVHVAT